MLKLDIGCGAFCHDGYVGVDKYYPGVAVPSDMAVLPYPPESVDEVYCSHTLEHLTYAEHKPALLEWMRVLKPGGKVVVIVPSMDYVAAIWLHGGDREYAQHIMFGGQTGPGDVHLSGFRPEDLRDLLTTCGFTVSRTVVYQDGEHHQESILCEATKP
jgi:predicted SAM-dependent methyltransferase